MKFFSEILGDFVDLPEEPRRIVSLAPDITDTLFRLNLDDRVIGVSLYCNRPKEKTSKLPRVGAYLNVLWDKLKELEPDIVFLTTGAQRKTALEVLNRGFPAVVLPLPNSVFGILENLRKVGVITGRLEIAENLAMDLLGVLNSLKEREIKARVYYEIDLGGEITAGGPSYITNALRILGLENIYSFKTESYFKPDDMETKSLKPDLIIYEPKPERRYKAEDIERSLRERFGDIPIIITEPDFLAHYGPSLIDEVLPDLKRKLEKFFQR
jgi:ABC-type Fe3+-hydroxamate transport system substrate-binding protein